MPIEKEHIPAPPDPTRQERINALDYDYENQERERAPSCNLCGAEYRTVLVHRDRYGFPAPTAACSRCGLAFLDPRMTAGAYSRFYEKIYRPLVSAYHGRRIDAVTVKEEQRTYSVEMARVSSPFLDGRRGGSFLDVGGSTGVVALHFAREFGLRPTVLDPAPDEIEEASASGLETITSFIEDWDPGRRRFDVIGMFQTIDHLLDAAASLRKLRSAIADDGLFIVDIVDFRAACLKNWSVEAATKIDHPFSFTEETAEAMLMRCGFRALGKAYSEDRHLVSYLCRPALPDPDFLPAPESVDRFFRELRYVQNAPSPAAGTP